MTLPPTFPMELEKSKEDTFLNRLKHKRPPEYWKALQEDKFYSMTINEDHIKTSWRPNNYRRQTEVKPRTDSTLQEIRGYYGAFPVEISKKKIVTWKNYNDSRITIQLGKNQLTGIWSQKIIKGEKETFFIEAKKKEEVKEFMESKKKDIQKEIDDAMFHFALRFKLIMYPFRPKWKRSEDWVRGDKVVRSLPKDAVIHHRLFKKVYEDGIECKPEEDTIEPTVYAIRHIENSITLDLAPNICNEIIKTRIAINPLAYLKTVLKGPDDVLKHIEIVKALCEDDKLELWKHMMEVYT